MNRLYTILNAGEQSTRRRGRLNIDQPQRPSNPDTFSPSGAPVVWDSSQIEPALHTSGVNSERAYSHDGSLQGFTPLSPSFSAPPAPYLLPAIELLPPPSRVPIAQRPYQNRLDVGYYPPTDAQYIHFIMEDGSGLKMRDALERNYAGLRERDNRTLLGSNLPISGSISIRIEWLGYPPYGKQIKALDWCQTRRQISLGRLGTAIAKVLESFIADMQLVVPNKNEPGCLEVGPVGSLKININDIFLIGLKHVSEGSWQPDFALFR